MECYMNLNGNSNVQFFSIGQEHIDVRFRNGGMTYRYTYQSAGKANVETMKELARQGFGLNSYIDRYVYTGYESKWK